MKGNGKDEKEKSDVRFKDNQRNRGNGNNQGEKKRLETDSRKAKSDCIYSLLDLTNKERKENEDFHCSIHKGR